MKNSGGKISLVCLPIISESNDPVSPETEKENLFI